MSDSTEPQSVADASAALAAVNFDADHLGEAPTEKEPIVAPATIGDRQRAGWEGATITTPTTPAAPATTPAATPAVPAPGTPPEDPAFTAWLADAAQQRDAYAIQQGLKTVDGVRLIVAQGLTALGKDPNLVQAFMEGRLSQQQVEASPTVAAPVAAPANPWDTLTEDDLIDGKQFQQYAAEVQRQAAAAAQAAVAAAVAPQQTAIQQERQVRASQVTDGTLVELLGEGGDVNSVDKELAGRVLAEAGKYIDPNNWDSGHIRAAIIQGHHDVVKIAEAAQRAYLNRKSLVAAGVPQTTGGAQAAGSEAPAEPKNVQEATKMAEKMGLFGN